MNVRSFARGSILRPICKLFHCAGFAFDSSCFLEYDISSFLGWLRREEPLSEMNLLDGILIGVLVISMFFSCWRGFIKDLFSILSLAGGVLVAGRLYPLGAYVLSRWITQPSFAKVAGFGLVFIISAFLIGLIGRLLRRFVQVIHLGWLDRWLGIGFGLVKGLLITAVIVLILVLFLPPKSEIIRGSKVAPILIQIARGVTALVPDGMKALFEKRREEIERFWRKQKEERKKLPLPRGSRLTIQQL